MAQADVPASSPAAITDFRIGNAAQMQQRAALLQRGEALLAQGDTSAAIDTLDRAAMMLHAPDAEMALVRAYMQGGEYRRALAFCAHTAGAHRETVAPSALYAWLLRAGGQDAYAKQVLAEARTRLPDDPVLAAATRELAGPSPRADAVLLDTPQRMAPYAVLRDGDVPVPASAQVVASGSLIDAGRHALVPTTALGEAVTVWVRNGLGETTAATVERRFDDLGLVLLALKRPLDPGAALAVAPRDPFAGSPGFTVTYGVTADAAPSWPWLHGGFLGGFSGADADSSSRRLGIAAPPGPLGGPVFDAAGRFAGLALAAPERLLPVSLLRQALGEEAVGRPALAAAGPRMPNDEVYERALRVAVQVIVVR